jgi:hypothetical protein
MGHITKEELQRSLGNSELINGFANRFCWIPVKRAQVLPESKCVDWNHFPEVLKRIALVLETFRWSGAPRALERSAEAQKIWNENYEALSSGYAGVLGGILNRAEAQVLRLSMLYAVCDASTLILPEHLRAALAVWRYAERSAKWIFGTATGNRRADKILWALQRKPEGLTRQDINIDIFQRNATKVDIDQALSVLVANKLAVPTEQHIPKGRPIELWKAL